MKWTSRERVIAAINHTEADRVPIHITPLYDFYLELKKYLGLEIEEEIKSGITMEVIPHPQVIAELGADITSVKLGAPQKTNSQTRSDDCIKDEWGVLYRKVRQPRGSYYEVAHSPLAEAGISDLQKYPWPAADLPGRGEAAEAAAKYLYENTDLAIMGRFGGPIVEMGVYLLGFEHWMTRAASEPEFTAAFLDKTAEAQMAFDCVGIQATAKYLNILKVSGEDLGMQTGTLYSPKMFHDLILPHLRRRWQAARKLLNELNPRVKIMLHSCGSVRKFIPDLIEGGIQILDPAQPRASGMDSFELKREFGDKLVFHGGIDIQQVLPFGTQEEVEEEVRTRIHAFAPGGGYILAPAHNVQADTPPANIVAMCQAAQKYGQYPLDLN